jgi:anti-sigma-K factor RskA
MTMNKKSIFGIWKKGGIDHTVDSYIDNELSSEERALVEAKINADSSLSDELSSQIQLQGALSSYFKDQEAGVYRPLNVWPELLRKIEQDSPGNNFANLLEGIFTKRALIAGAAFSMILAVTLTNFSNREAPSTIAAVKALDNKSENILLSSTEAPEPKRLNLGEIDNKVNQIIEGNGDEESVQASLANNAPVDYEWLRSERNISFVPVSGADEMPVIWVNASAR